MKKDMDNHHKNKDESFDFSLVLGGPLYQFYIRTFLAKPPLNLYTRRIITISLFAWLPILILAIISGTAFSGSKLPFIYDIETHARFLLSLSLLIAAEVVVHKRFRIIVGQFIHRDIIAPEDHDRFHKIIDSAMSLRNSIFMEVALIILVFTLGQWIRTDYLTISIPTWYAMPLAGHMQFTLPGYWYAFVSLPVYQFILLRWYYRLFIWYRFLWQISRMPLQLNSLHPDKMGGLGFLTNGIYALEPLLMAHSVLVAGFITNRIWHTGAALIDFKLDLLGLAFFLTLLVLTPLFFFVVPLNKSKRSGTLKYGIVASRYVNAFRSKWINDQHYQNETLLGAGDIQSLADLSNSFQVSQDMRVFPFTGRNILQMLAVIAIPLLPLLLTMFNVEEILKLLLRIIM